MSFNSEMKKELCSVSLACPGCAAAECLGIMLYGAKFSADSIHLQSLSQSVRNRILWVSRQVFGPLLIQEDHSLIISDPDHIRAAFEAFGYEYGRSSLQLNRAIVEEDCCKHAFLRGILLTGGYVSSPEKSYHLELVTPRYPVAQQTMTLLSEMGLNPGYIQRRGNHILYFKDSSVIEEVLTIAGAGSSAMKIMVQKVERELNNKINRKINCDTANLDKTVAAAEAHISAIRKLDQAGKLSALPAAFQHTARLRTENPELSLSELCALHQPPLSRAGLNNRLKKLIRLSEEL